MSSLINISRGTSRGFAIFLLVLSGCFGVGGENALDSIVDKGGGELGNQALEFDVSSLEFGDIPRAPSYLDQTVKITNTFTGSVYIDHFESDNTVFSIVSTDCAMAPLAFRTKETCNLTVRYSPTALGTHTATIKGFYGGSASEADEFHTLLAANGRSTESAVGNTAIAFDPAAFDYGDVAIAPSFGEKTFHVTNTTNAAYFISAISSNNPLFAIMSNACVVGGAPTSIAAGASCDVVVRFSPLADGEQSAFLTVAYGPDSPRAGTLSARSTLTGRSTSGPLGNSAIGFNPSYWDYGDVAAGDTSTKAIVLTNAKTTPIYLSGVSVTNSKFTITANTCPMGGSTALAASATCQVTVRFAPTADGGQAADVRVSYGPDQARNSSLLAIMAVAGRSSSTSYGNTAIAFTPSYWDFGDVANGVTSIKGVTVTNVSASAVYVSSVTRTSASSFTLGTTCPSGGTLAAGASCVATMSFTPSADGGYSSDLTASYGPDAARGSSVQSKAVFIGRSKTVAFGSTALGWSLNYWDFGDVAANTTVSKQFTLTQSGTDPVTISGITLATGGVPMTISHNCPLSPTAMAPSATCLVTVNFTPTADGSWNSDLRVTYGPDAARSTNVQVNSIITGRSTATIYGATNITFSPSYYDFDDVAAGQNSTLSGVTLTNSGTQPVHISGLSSNNTKFTITSTTCPTSPSTLGAGANCVIAVRFAPTADGVQTGKITAAFGPDATRSSNLQSFMTVAGHSTAVPTGQEAITFSPNHWDFGDKAVGQSGTKVITLTNASGTNVYFSSSGSNFASSNASFYKQTTNCPTGSSPLASGATCTITMKYEPSASTPFEYTTVTVQHGPDVPRNANLSATFTLSGHSSSASTGNVAVTFSPVFWDFGDVASGTTVNKVITMTNSSADPIHISGISRTNGTLFLLSDDCPRSPTPLAAGGTCNLTYSFAPTTDGGQTSTGTVNYGPDQPRSADYNAKFVVAGRSTAVTRGNPSLTFTPAFFDYGDVASGVNSDREYVVTNTSSTAVYLSATTSDNSVFLVVPPSSGACPTGATPLNAGATCNVKVRFTPTSDGPQNANIAVAYGPDSSRSGNQSAKLLVAGRSTAVPSGEEMFSFSPDYWDYGDVAANNGTAKTFTITNVSGTNAYISGVTRTNTSVYTLTHNCPISPTPIAANGTCDITVTFTPTTDGVQTAKLTVTHGVDHARSTSVTQAISLTGRSTAATSGNTGFAFSPVYWDFGDIAAGQTSLKGVTVTNQSGASIYFKASSPLTTSNSKFTISGSTCPTGATSLGNGASCKFDVTFAPTTDGAQDTEVQLTYGPDQLRAANQVSKMVMTGRSTASPIGNTAVTFTPTFWDFGDVAAGQTVTKNFTVTNASTAAIHISTAYRTNSSIFTISDDCPRTASTLGSTITCTMTVGFTPTGDGAQTSDISLAYGPDAARSGGILSKLSVAGRSFATPLGAEGVHFNPTYYDYGNITGGSTQDAVIQVQNATSKSLYISNIAESAAEYSITADACPRSPTAFLAGATCNVTVRYAPTDTGTDTTGLVVTYGPDAARSTNLTNDMMITGRSEPIPIGNSAIQINPNSFDFGNVPLSPSYSDKVVQLTNNSVSNVYIGGYSGLASPYSVAGTDCPASPTALAASAVCGVTVRFSPVTGAQASATLSVQYGQSSSTPTQYVSQASFTGRSNPVAPSNFAITSNDANSISFSWDDNSFDESMFEIDRCDGAACETTFTAAAGVTVAANSTSYTWNSLPEGAFYQFRVRAKVSSTASSWLTGPMAITFGGVTTSDNGAGSSTTLSAVNCTTYTAGSYVRLDWNNASVASYYELFDMQSGSPQFITTINAPSTGYLLSGLDPNVPHKYLVKARTTSGITSKNTATTNVTTTYYSPCVVLGQQSEPTYSITGVSSQTPAGNVNSMRWSMNQPRSVFSIGTYLFVADQTNHRVLIYRGLKDAINSAPDVVLGQPDWMTNTANWGGRSARTLNQPMGVTSDGTKLYVSDTTNNRVLIWNTIPTTNFTAADIVLGQPSFSGGAANANTGSCNAGAASYGKTMSGPNGIAVVNGKLIVADNGNNRVMIWNTIPTTNYTAADVAIGSQTAWSTACTGGTSSTLIGNAGGLGGVWSDGTKLFVVDRGNNRVLMWNTIPTSFNAAAAAALGQPDLVTGTANTGGSVTGARLNQPWGVTGYGTDLYVSDYNNNRVLYFPSSAWVTNGSATKFIGQTSLTSGVGATYSTSGVSSPIAAAVAANGSLLYVANYGGNARVTRYPTSTWAAGTFPYADTILAQPRFTTNNATNIGIDGQRLSRPWGVWSTGSKLLVSDYYYNRVHIYSNMPTSNMQASNIMLGQLQGVTGYDPNQNLVGVSVTANTLSGPAGVWSDGTRVMVADSGNRRVLIWKTAFPTSNGQAATTALGQASLTTSAAGLTSSGMNTPVQVTMTLDPDQTTNPGLYDIWALDSGYHRLTLYLTTSTMSTLTTGTAAQFAFGQPNLTSNTATVTDVRFNTPRGFWTNGTKLAVADTNNNRVMLWHSITTPLTYDVPADVVLGQPGVTVNVANNGATPGTALDTTLNAPTAVWYDGTKLFVADQGNHRVLVWNQWPTNTQEPADTVIGQTNFANITLNAGAGAWWPTSYTFQYPTGLWSDGTRLFISDGMNVSNAATQTNQRVVVIPSP